MSAIPPPQTATHVRVRAAIRIPMKHDGFFFSIEGYTNNVEGPYLTHMDAYAAAVDKADEIADILDGGNMS